MLRLRHIWVRLLMSAERNMIVRCRQSREAYGDVQRQPPRSGCAALSNLDRPPQDAIVRVAGRGNYDLWPFDTDRAGPQCFLDATAPPIDSLYIGFHLGPPAK
jgi:hypothetical protein